MAKKLNIKVPKRIAGMKIPKAVRKGPIRDFLNSSGGQVLLAELLLAAGSIYAARWAKTDSQAGEGLRRSLESLRSGRGWSGDASERLARAFGAGVQAFRAALYEPAPGGGLKPDPGYAASGSDGSGGGETSRKKHSSRSETSLREATSSH